MTLPAVDAQYEASARSMWSNFIKAATIGAVFAATVLLIMAATLV